MRAVFFLVWRLVETVATVMAEASAALVVAVAAVDIAAAAMLSVMVTSTR